MAEPRKVLVVDDDPEISELLRVRLAHSGYDVRAYRSGEEALAGTADWVPDVAILDFMMPGMHGFQLCKALRDDPRMERTRIVILSAKSYRPDRDAAKRVGADAYLVKPINFVELLKELEAPRGESTAS